MSAPPVDWPALARSVEWITFDCYGTLIDWYGGIRAVLRGLTDGSDAGLRPIIEAYVKIEADIEAGPYRSYRQVQAATLHRLADRFDFALPANRADELAAGLPDWRPFDDTNDALQRLGKKYHLGVLSNIDHDLFASTARHFAVSMDLVILAEDVRAYKPDHAHFLRMLDRVGGTGRVLHVAQSLYHDGAPAAELGIPFVWLNRYADRRPASTVMVAEMTRLTDLADGLEVASPV